MNEFIAGLVGGSAGLIIGHPLDTIKAIMQTKNEKNMLSASKHVFKSSNFLGFFRGLSLPLMSYGFINSILFGVYGNSLKYLNSESNDPPTFTSIYIAGAISGVVTAFPNNPLEVIKLQLQTHNTHEIKGVFECSRNIVKSEGYQGFFKGFKVLLLRDVPSYGVYFGIFEYFNRLGKQQNGQRDEILIELVGGGLAGCVAWAIIMPLDVVKSIIQASTMPVNAHKSIASILKSLGQEYGLRGYFKGLNAVLIRGFLVNAITFCVYKRTLILLE